MQKSILYKKILTILLDQFKYRIPERIINERKLKSYIWHVGFNTNVTRFSMGDYIKVSKKLRSNVVNKVDYDINIYSFKGILISDYMNPLNTSYLIRNVFDSIPYETRVILYSPAVDYVTYDPFIQLIYNRSKLYYLRNKPLPQSEIPFTYIVGLIPLDSWEDERISDYDISSTELYAHTGLR
jgi:ribosomal protein L19